MSNGCVREVSGALFVFGHQQNARRAFFHSLPTEDAHTEEKRIYRKDTRHPIQQKGVGVPLIVLARHHTQRRPNLRKNWAAVSFRRYFSPEFVYFLPQKLQKIMHDVQRDVISELAF